MGIVSAFWDFLPTACEVANIEQPANIDGISFREKNNLADQFPEVVAQIDKIMEQEHEQSDVFPFGYERSETGSAKR